MLTLPWTEKYRPTLFEDIILDSKIKATLENVNKNNFPNILLFGPPGIGKTTTAINICKSVLADKSSYMELNASDNRGINMVYDLIQSFCKKKLDETIKIIILDEADNITKKAQEQLINFIENYPFIRFIFTCNDSNQIIESLQSRCLCIRFKRPKINEIKTIIKKIIEQENITISDDMVLTQLLLYSNYDIRRTINNLEALSYLYKEINQKSIKKYFNNPDIECISKIFYALLIEKNIDKAFGEFMKLMKDGLNTCDFILYCINILNEIDEYESYFKEINLTDDKILLLLEQFHDCYYRINKIIESKLQIIRLFHDICNL